jgi:micrococcal nuclease
MLIMACVVLAAAAWAGGVGRELTSAPAPASLPGDGIPTGTDRASVVHVIDGDTVRVRVTDGGTLPPGEHRVRLLGIDSPEMNVESGAPECGAVEATAFLESLLDGHDVWLQTDREDRDRFDRPLRYAWTGDGTLVNRAIVAAGHAEAVRLEPNDRYWDVLRSVESEARADEVGLWGTCPN